MIRPQIEKLLSFLQQLSAAVRADLLDLPNGAGVVVQNEFHSKEVQLCQDGSTPKIFSVILGCSSSHQHSDLELRSTCKEDHVNLHKGILTIVILKLSVFFLCHSL